MIKKKERKMQFFFQGFKSSCIFLRVFVFNKQFSVKLNIFCLVFDTPLTYPESPSLLDSPNVENCFLIRKVGTNHYHIFL